MFVQGEELLTHAKEELGESGYLNTALEMAAYHHEWWNGKGVSLWHKRGRNTALCKDIGVWMSKATQKMKFYWRQSGG